MQMDFRRRFAGGKLSELLLPQFSALSLAIDEESKSKFTTRSGEPLVDVVLQNSSTETQALLDAYARGVNVWIDKLRNGDEPLPPEYDASIFQIRDGEGNVRDDFFADWTPQDSISTILVLIDLLTNQSDREITLGTRRAVMSEAQVTDIVGLRPFVRSAITDADQLQSYWLRSESERLNTRLSRGSVEGLSLLERAAITMGSTKHMTGLDVVSRGSNSWAVGPEKSATGRALLSNDPHLLMSTPAIWYVAHLDAKTNGSGTTHVAGMTLAGMPWVVIGQNEDIAWGTTNSQIDFADVYMETLSEDRSGVVFNGETVPFTEKDLEFKLADGTTETRHVRWVPHHGPVVEMDEEAGTAVTIRWTGQDMTTDINLLTELAKATNIDEAREAFRLSTALGQNWTVIDSDDNIGWFPYTTVPTRPWADTHHPSYPLPGTGEAEWGDPVPLEQLPQMTNPAAGYFATANNDMTGAQYNGTPWKEGQPITQGTVAVSGYRHLRITEMLASRSDHDVTSMHEMVLDDLVGIGRDTTPAILAVVDTFAETPGEAEQQVIDALRAWSYTCPTGLEGNDPESAMSANQDEVSEALGCSAFHAFLGTLTKNLVGDEWMAATGKEIGNFAPYAARQSLVQPDRLLQGDIYWDDVTTTDVVETKADIITKTLIDAHARLEEAFGVNEPWLWGRAHLLTLPSDLNTASNGLVQDFDLGPFAGSGGVYTVNLANPRSDFSYRFGPSARLICEATDQNPSCSFQLPGGQSGVPDETHFGDLIDSFLAGTPLPLHFDAQAVDDAAVSSFTLHGPR